MASILNIMLTARELQLVLLLTQHDFSGEELAQSLNLSRRTIIREIARINSVFAEQKIGHIDSFNSYHLTVLNPNELERVLAQIEQENNHVLYELLVNENISMAELGEQTYLSRQSLLNIIQKLNQQYQSVFSIESKIGAGYFLQIKRITRIDVLANLFLTNHELFVDRQQHYHGVVLKKVLDRLREKLVGRVFDYLTVKQLQAQILACLECADISLSNNDLIPNLMSGIDLTLKQRQSIAVFFSNKIKLLDKLTLKQIQNSVTLLEQKYNVNGEPDHFTEEIYNHLCRCVMFPTLVSAVLAEQIQDLKIKNPFAFDFAFDLTKQLNQFYPHVQIDAEYIALYVLRMFEGPAERDVRVLMYATQRSVANINILILSEQIANLEIDTVFSKQDFLERLQQLHYDLLIANGPEPTELVQKGHFDLSFKGVAGQKQLEQLRGLSNNTYIQQNLASFFPKNNFVYLPGQQRTLMQILKHGLTQFVERSVMTQADANKLIDRENAGNQLILNHVSIPHATKELTKSYEVFGIAFDGQQQIGKVAVTLILAVFVNQQRADNGQIFGYFYHSLKDQQLSDMQKITKYEQIRKILK